jgi:NAD+ diphosphatase
VGDWSFEAGVSLADEPGDDAWTFAFCDRRLLVHQDAEGAVRLPVLAELTHLTPPVRRQYLGTLDGRQLLAMELIEEAEPPPGMAFLGLRRLHPGLAEPFFQLAGRAIQIVDWDRDHQFCSRCAEPLVDDGADRSKRCRRCELRAYPRLAPAVIVAVDRGREILLARSPHFPPGMYSTLAGFVEPGESLEETVQREIAEEVGIEVGDVRYFARQPWPFPHSLMIGFTASYASGEIVVDGEEIEDASFYDVENLPKIPPRISIARALIEDFRTRALGRL